MTPSITVKLKLTAKQAAALKRFADKISYTHASSVLYPHLDAEIRSGQVRDILSAFAELEKALIDSHSSAWPWIDTGFAGETDPGKISYDRSRNSE